MAIQLDLTATRFGVGFTAAYGRIVTASVQRQNGTPKFKVMLDVAVYAAPPSDYTVEPVHFERVWAPLDAIEVQAGGDFLSRCYEWLAGSPEFSGAVSV